MREIKFRGKRIDNGEWVFGSFIPDALEGSNSDLISWGFIRRYNRGVGKMETIEVDRETVGQYTGLKDKGGVEIYEGDICKYWMDRVWKIGYIVWHQGGFALRVFKMGERDTDEMFPFQHFIPVPRTGNVMQDQFEIIGTTHDNPELLGGTE
jgi:uncharacterized phage protein (TIGR01671 family)